MSPHAQAPSTRSPPAEGSPTEDEVILWDSLDTSGASVTPNITLGEGDQSDNSHHSDTESDDSNASENDSTEANAPQSERFQPSSTSGDEDGRMNGVDSPLNGIQSQSQISPMGSNPGSDSDESFLEEGFNSRFEEGGEHMGNFEIGGANGTVYERLMDIEARQSTP